MEEESSQSKSLGPLSTALSSSLEVIEGALGLVPML